MPKHYYYLLIAVAFEMFGTANLQASQQFTRLWPSVLVILGFVISMYFLTLTLKYMPVGVVYALWSGLGIVAIAAMGHVLFKQAVDFWAVVGMAMIIAGIAVIQLLSKTATH